VSKSISGLSANTTYHFKLVAYNSGGTSYGTDQTFTTLPNPLTLSTGSASEVTQTSATLWGQIDPNDGSASYYFEYGLTGSYGSITSTTSGLTGSGAQSVSQSISGLSPNTVYHFRVVAYNSGGTSYGADQTFTTLPNPPTVTTGSASGVTQTSATLWGQVDPNDGSTSYYFEYGLTDSYGSITSTTSGLTGSGAQSVSQSISGLSADTTYYYRLVAYNSGGTSYGVNLTFTTRNGGVPLDVLMLLLGDD
jgi:phosphodiesterase/alkaline phosphatase D-like protein